MGAGARSELEKQPAISGAHRDDDDANQQGQVVTPWAVTCTGTAAEQGVNYDKVVAQFGCQCIDAARDGAPMWPLVSIDTSDIQCRFFLASSLDAALVERIARLTSRPPHRFLRRGIFFAHRDLDKILDLYERGDKFYLYTGRGPSSEALHFGHLVPFIFTKYLQDAFKVPLVIQLTDDEKFLWKNNLSIAECKRLTRENAKDIIACGFDVQRTFIFSDFSFVGGAFYENMNEVAKRVTVNNLRATFGISLEDHIGKVSFPPVQAAPSFASSFPHLFAGNEQLRCLVPCAIDQDPYFRMTRDVAPKIGYQKPSLIESKFFPALQGESGKMSASDPNTAIYLTDKPDVIAKKINKYAFSGGQSTEESHRKYGANLDVDIPIKYLSFFLEDDDMFEKIKKEYKEGNKLTGEVKVEVVKVLTELAKRHQNARAQVTEEMVDAFMAARPLSDIFS